MRMSRTGGGAGGSTRRIHLKRAALFGGCDQPTSQPPAYLRYEQRKANSIRHEAGRQQQPSGKHQEHAVKRLFDGHFAA